MQRSNFIAGGIIVLITVVCVTVGSTLEQASLGWIVAGIVSILVAVLAKYSPEERILAGGFFILTFLVWFSSNRPLALLIGAAFTTVSFYVSGLSIKDLFVGTGIDPLVHIVKVFLGLQHGLQVVEAPPTGVQQESRYKFGPRTVIVKPDAAAVMVQGSRLTRVQGPSIFVTQPFEYVERVYNLRPIHKNYHLKEVLTRDSTPMEVEVSIVYGIQVGIATRLGEVKLTDEERSALRALSAWAPDWEAALKDIVEKNIRRTVGRLALAQVLDIAIQLDVQRRTMIGSTGNVEDWGLRIYELHIVSIHPDETVVNASLDNWLVRLTNQTLIRKELGRGTAWARAIIAIASAYNEANGMGLPDTVIYRELVRRLFEQAAMDPAARSLLQSELRHMMTRRDVDQLPPAP